MSGKEWSEVLMALALVVSSCAVAQGQQAGYESFEDGVPGYFAATRADSLSISPWHSKQGKSSLRWDWAQGDELVIRHGIGDVTRRGGLSNNNRASFAVWVYMEKPVSEALVFEFREGDKVTGSFRFPLQFTGWRQGRPYYQDFPTGKPTSAVDNIRIVAPSQVAKGTTFLDFIKYNTLTYSGRAIVPEKEARWRHPEPDAKRFPKPDKVTDTELAGIRKLLGDGEGPGVDEARVKELCAQVAALGIVRDEHGLRGGPSIDRHYQYCGRVGEHGARESTYWSDENGPAWMGMQIPSAMTSLGYQIASTYRASRDPEQRRRLADAFLLIEDYLYDQGMQAGAGFHWNWWVGEPWANAVFMMRDVLAQAGRLDRQCDYMLWNYGGDAVFADTPPPSHMDYYHLYVSPILRSCLVQVEPAEQVRWLNAFMAMLERSMLQPTSALKVDGSAYHHGVHYFAYARNAFGTLPGLLQQLSDTPWRLSPEAHERFRRAMLAQRLYCNQLDLPLSLSGRRPFSSDFYIKGGDRIAPQGLDVLARCGTPDGKQALDREVAAAYLRLVPEAVNQEPYRSLGIKPEPDPNGTFVMPYAALLCHRRDNWLACVHGQSKYLWGSERDDNVNCFGLFQSLGSLEILAGGTPVSANASGRNALGWDWRHHEGTTAPELPLDKIAGEVTTTYSPETFVGGLSHQGRQGIYAMAVNQAMPGKKTLAGRKSWFFSDNRIICLGSDISCSEAEYPTQTTLCQKSLPKDEKGAFAPTVLDGADFSALPEDRNLDQARPHWFVDVQQTGYYLPAGQKVTVARRHQKSREYANARDTEGDFLTAWIDHGKAPAGAAYEYMLVVRATPATMGKLVATPPYRVLQRDQAAHIVWDTAGSRWGCAFFVPQEVTAHTVAPETLQVKAVDRPCLIMQEPMRDGKLALSVADPDLNLDKGVNQPRPLRVTLRGVWRVAEATGSVCAWGLPEAKDNVRIVSTGAGETVVEIVCQDGASYDLRLVRG
ncbi:MAG: chondroitinase family polysaccharide lyase [Armatimonadia bacterium]